MNRILLTCIALSLPSFVAAAPCDVLPYASQCQGSNLWPVPAGWTPDSNGDCQPQAALSVCATGTITNPWEGRLACSFNSNISWNHRMTVPGSFTTQTVDQYGGHDLCEAMNQVWTPIRTTTLVPHPGPGINTGLAPKSCYGWSWSVISWGCQQGQSGGWVGNPLYMVHSCPSGWSLAFNRSECEHLRNGAPAAGITRCCLPTSLSTKPSDGVCTARWTSSAETALQKDPLDPDCDANSCVLDGFCRLR